MFTQSDLNKNAMEILQSNTQEKYRREREEFKRAFSELQQRMKSDARILGEIIQLKERLVHLEGEQEANNRATVQSHKKMTALLAAFTRRLRSSVEKCPSMTSHSPPPEENAPTGKQSISKKAGAEPPSTSASVNVQSNPESPDQSTSVGVREGYVFKYPRELEKVPFESYTTVSPSTPAGTLVCDKYGRLYMVDTIVDSDCLHLRTGTRDHHRALVKWEAEDGSYRICPETVQELCERNIRCPYNDSPKNIPFYVEAFNTRNECFFQLKAFPEKSAMKNLALMLTEFVDLSMAQYFADLSICLFWPDHIRLLQDMLLEKANKQYVCKLSNKLQRLLKTLEDHFGTLHPNECALKTSTLPRKRARVMTSKTVDATDGMMKRALVDKTESKSSSVPLTGTTSRRSSTGETIFFDARLTNSNDQPDCEKERSVLFPDQRQGNSVMASSVGSATTRESFADGHHASVV